MAFTGDIQRAWNEGGPKILLTRSIRKLVRPALKVGTLVFTECDLREAMPECHAVPGITVREATVDDVKLFEDKNVFIERVQKGRRCFVGIEDSTGKLTNYRWVNTSSPYIPELKRYLVMQPGEVYVYDLKTLPEFRRRGIDAYTRHYAYSYLRDTGFTKIYAYIHGDNHPSLRASRYLLKPIRRVWYVQPRGCEPIMIGRRRGCPEFSPRMQQKG